MDLRLNIRRDEGPQNSTDLDGRVDAIGPGEQAGRQVRKLVPEKACVERYTFGPALARVSEFAVPSTTSSILQVP